jgi:molybdate-binding protein/DNA-binding transcriptional ArsR family regulator
MNKSLDYALFKVLGHPERIAILRRLMAAPATLTQLGAFFNKTPAHIRHHLLVLEQAGVVEFVEARPVQGGPEKYYHATQGALFIHHAVLPENPKEMITIASMDTGIQHLANHLALKQAPFSLLPIPLSSLDGLIALRQGLCQMSTCHLIDPESGEYNQPFIRHLFPCQSMVLIRVYQREEGLVVKPGNPLRCKTLEDLARSDILFVNREPGSGVRQWLDLQLKRLGIPSESIPGYAHVANSHAEVARVILEGKANLGIGIAAIARKFGLDFIPLYEEPYEIAAPLSFVSDKRYAPFFETLNSGEIRTALQSLDGYTVPQNSGETKVIC